MTVLSNRSRKRRVSSSSLGGLLVLTMLVMVLSGCPKMVGIQAAIASGDSSSTFGGVNSRGGSPITLVADNWWQVAPAFGLTTETGKQSRSILRTIVADPYMTNTPLYFYAVATSGTGSNFPLTKVNFTADATQKAGSVQIPLGHGSWDVDVYACLIDNLPTIDRVRDDAVLKGSAHVDTMNTSTVFFTLSPKGLTRSARINLTLNPATELQRLTGLTAKASIRDLETGSIVFDKTNTSTEKTVNNFPAARGSYGNFDLAPGTYLFQLELTTAGGDAHIWSDVIIVLPGKTMSITLEIPNFVGTIPASPTNFKAGLVTSSEDAGLGTYQVKLDWNDASDNESHFELEVAELVQGSTVQAYPTTDGAWTTLMTGGTTAIPYGKDFYSSSLRVAGSLNAGNTSLTLNLLLGRRYVVRLRAVGGAGASPWVYPDLQQAPTGTTAITSTTINRFAVIYNLAGGTYTPNTGAATTENQVQYHSQNNTGIQLLAPTAATGANSLLKDNGQWGGWQNTGTGVAYPTNTTPTPYTDFKNLGLVAQYVVKQVNLGFTAITHNAVELQINWITVGNRAINNNMISISKASGPNLNFVVQVPNTPYPFNMVGFSYETMELDIKNNRGVTVFAINSNAPVNAGTSHTFTMPNLANRTSGNYICTIRARYSPSIVVSQQFILILTN